MYKLQVPNLHCNNCAGRVTRAIASVDPTATVQTDIPHREISVETTAAVADIRAALDRIGYAAR
ncbi:MAG: heavy-metal-associated domain-containing protein [Bauldia sp.]